MNKNKKILTKLRIGVVVGGTSEEINDVICTAHEVSKALENLGNHVEIITFDDRFEKAIRYAELDEIFIIDATYMGKLKISGELRDVLERLKLPYTGSRSRAAAVTKNKSLSKKYFEQCKLLTPAYLEVDNRNIVQLKKLLIRHKVEVPYVIKPRDEGSGMDVLFIKTSGELYKITKKLLNKHKKLVVEHFIGGMEVTVPILEVEGKNVPLSVVEIEKAKEIKVFSNDIKSLLQFSPQIIGEKSIKYHIPARLNKVVFEKAMKTAITAHESIGCRGYSRVDMIIDNTNNIYVLEINSLPTLSENGIFSRAAKLIKLEYNDIVNYITRSALVS